MIVATRKALANVALIIFFRVVTLLALELGLRAATGRLAEWKNLRDRPDRELDRHRRRRPARS